MGKVSPEFWREKKLHEMNAEEWESLCDGCALCCLHKLEDEDTGEIHLTSVACRYLDCEEARCSVYAERSKHVAECIVLSPDNLEVLKWMPPTCAYRLVHEGKPLPQWHPLLNNNLHEHQMSARNSAISEDNVSEDDFQDYIICQIKA